MVGRKEGDGGLLVMRWWWGGGGSLRRESGGLGGVFGGMESWTFRVMVVRMKGGRFAGGHLYVLYILYTELG